MGLMKKLTSALVASSLVLSLAGSAFAAYTPSAGETAGMRMMELKILKGRPGDDKLAVNAELTRAELVTIIVRAFGKEADAQLLKGATAFPDSASHWASGEIAMAKALVEKAGSDAIGMPDGTFAPDAKLTPAQAVAFLMKFMGIKRDTTKSWPADYLDAAVEAGLITADDKATIAPMVNENATRGLAFYLFDNAFYSYELPNGKTFYTTYADTEAPALTATAEATTMDSKVTVTGTVGTDAVAVYVGSTKVTADANGAFSADVALAEVKEYDILVTAADVAGNVAEKTLKVARIIGTASAIEASDITVAAGATVEVKAEVKDAKGNVVKDAAVTGESAVGTFEAGKFTASTTAGEGKLTLKFGELTKEVNVKVTAGALDSVKLSASSVAPGAKVTLTGVDAHGNALTGVAFTQTSADALIDSTQGVFIASKAGTYTVTAKAGDVEKTVTIGVYDAATVGSYKITLGSATLTANKASTTTLEIQALDKNGNANVSSTIISAPVFATAGLRYSTDDGDTWTDVSSNSGAPTTMTLKNGYAKVLVRSLNAVGGQTSVITVGSGTAATKANLALVDQVATSVKVDNSATYLPSNDAVANVTTFSVKVLDQDGKVMRNGYFPVSISLNAVDAEIDAVGTLTPGTPNVEVTGAPTTSSTATVYFSGANFDTAGTYNIVKVSPKYVGATGTVTVTATGTNLTAGNDTVTMQLAGPAAKLTVTASVNNVESPKAGLAFAGDAMVYTIGATDAAGVPVADASAVWVNFPGLTSTTRGEIQVLVNGVATAINSSNNVAADANDVITIAAETYTGNLEFVVKSQSATGLATAPAMSVAFGAGVANTFTYKVNDVTTNVIEVTPNAEVTIKATLKDAAGNSTTNSAAKIKIEAAGTLGGTADDVVINGTAGAYTADVAADGTATFTVKTGAFVGANYTLTLTGTYTNSAGATPALAAPTALQVAVKNVVASNVSVALFSDAARTTPLSVVNAGTAVYGTAVVTDAAGRAITTETLKVQLINADGTFTTVDAAVTDGMTLDGKYDFVVTPTKAPATGYKVSTTKSVTAGSAQFSVGVRPGTMVAGVDVAGDATQSINRNVEKSFTVTLTDGANGNAVINANNVNRQIQLSFAGNDGTVQVRTASGGLASATNIVNVVPGASSVTFYVVTNNAAGDTFTMTATDVTTGTFETITLNTAE